MDRPRGRRDLVPVVVTAVVGVVSLGLLLLASARGWLGPDVDRGGHFCEAGHDGLLVQPVNALSNLAFVVVGLLIAWRARWPRGRLVRPYATTALAVVVTLLGPASMAMHATESALGGRLDMLSMYLVASFATAYALVRVTGRGTGTGAVVFIGLVLVCEVVESSFGALPVVDHAGNAVFAALLVATVVLEALLIPRVRRHTAWGVGAVLVMVIAFAVWLPSHDGGALCDPLSLLQGHGVWHVLCAVAVYCLYRLWAGESAR